MSSDLPKVLHSALGTPLIGHVLARLAPLRPDRVVVVVGHREELVREALRGRTVSFVTAVAPARHGARGADRLDPDGPGGLHRPDPRGGHAARPHGVAPAAPRPARRRAQRRHGALGGSSRIPPATAGSSEAAAGRSRRSSRKRTRPRRERAVREVNSGIYAFEKEPLERALQELRADNAQKEYYLTDTLAILRQRGERGRRGARDRPARVLRREHARPAPHGRGDAAGVGRGVTVDRLWAGWRMAYVAPAKRPGRKAKGSASSATWRRGSRAARTWSLRLPPSRSSC